MRSRKPLPLNLSPKARQDFIDILRYSGETWGQDQMLIYRNKISDALLAIGRNPQLGHHRDDLPKTHYAYLVGAHIIVYRIDMASSVGVVRILHQRMSVREQI